MISLSSSAGPVGLAVLFLLGASGGLPAAAQSSPGGQLRCDVRGGVDFIFGSSKALDCVFAPNSGEQEYYAGTINKFGIDIGFQRGGTILWAVLSPKLTLGPGSLQGKYFGGTAQVVAGVGASANALVGANKVALNPLSGGGATGLDVAAGIAGLELVYIRGR
ncbi:MAG: DUF992 domain-containing protein [Methyloceanibacter sp.]